MTQRSANELVQQLAHSKIVDHSLRRVYVALGLIYGQFLLAVTGVIPFWTTLLTFHPLLMRWMLSLHEVFHARPAHEAPFYVRFLSPVVTPLQAGYREYRQIHLDHHRSMCTPDDPDLFHMQGGKLRGFLVAMSTPEQHFVRWVARRGIDREFATGVAIRFTIFAGLIALSGWNFLWYWVPLRLSWGTGYFYFFYHLHRRGDEFGVYRFELSPWAARLFVWLYGSTSFNAMCLHDLHHAYPQVDAADLHKLLSAEAAPH